MKCYDRNIRGIKTQHTLTLQATWNKDDLVYHPDYTVNHDIQPRLP